MKSPFAIALLALTVAAGCSDELPSATAEPVSIPSVGEVTTTPLGTAADAAAGDVDAADTTADPGDASADAPSDGSPDTATTAADSQTNVPDSTDQFAPDTGPGLVELPCQSGLQVDPVVETRCPDTPALAGCYTFDADIDQGDGTWQVLDGSPWAAHAASNAGLSYAPGLHDTAAVFAGAQQASIAWHAGFSAVNTATVDVWIEIDDVPSSGRWGIVDGFNAGQTIFVYADGVLRCNTNNLELRSDPGAIPTGRWTHLACVVDETGQRAYVDGTLVAEGPPPAPFTVTQNGDTVEIGANRPTDDFFVGRMDTARIWTTARTPADICLAASQRPAP